MSGNASIFARKIQELRAKKGLTQMDLAKALECSETTIDSWERAAEVPSMDVLHAIADFFQISTEDLLQKDGKYFLGIDGGGTKTDLVLTDSAGRRIRALQVSGCNPVDIGFDKSADLLKTAICDICRDIPFSSVYAFAGIAGGISAGMKERFHSFFESFRFKAFGNDSDNVNAIAAGLGKRDGISVTMGTGICAFIQKNRQHSRIGGWGYLIDNGGSGYNLGRDALNAYFCAYDGTGQATVLSRLIDETCPGGPQKILAHIYSGGKKAIAAFAPAVFAAIEMNDEIAVRILEQNMKAAAHIIETAAKQFSCDTIPVILTGGLTKQPIVPETIRKIIDRPERFAFDTLNCPPVDGAAALARELAEKEC